MDISVRGDLDPVTNATREHQSLLEPYTPTSISTVSRGHDDRSSSVSGSPQSKSNVESHSLELKNGEYQQKVKTSRWLAFWWTDLTAAITSVGLLLAVVIVLLSVDDTPLTDWSMPFGMQPTTLVATLMTLCKLFLLEVVAEGISQLKWVYFEQRPHKLEDLEQFDSASRGVLGSLQFLFVIRWQALTGVLGAIITILAVAMGPFAQQSLSFYTKALDTGNSTASVPRAIAYDLNTGTLLTAASQQTSNSKQNYPYMLSGIFEGLYNPGNIAGFNCETTNCTWQAYETLGICSTCEDVTTSLTKTCHHDEVLSNLIATSDGSPGELPGYGHCKFTTPGGVELVATCAYNEWAPSGGNHTLWASATSFIDDWERPQPPTIIDIAGLLVSNPKRSCPVLDRKFSMPPPQTIECSLRWCLKTFESQVVNGTMSEILVKTEDLVFPTGLCNGTEFLGIPDLFPAWAARRDGTGDGVFTYAAFKKEDVPEDLCSDWQLRDKPVFWVNVEDSANIRALINTAFDGYVTNMEGSVFGNMLFTVNNGNLTANVNAVAASMTNAIRRGPNSTAHFGIASTNETYIRVNWNWLTYPAALVFLSILFLIGTMVFSSEKSRVVWKSSSLALLFHGLKESDRETSVRKQSDMKEAAKQMWVRLKEDDNGDLNFVRGQHQNPA
ncbi:hypothetical protein LTR37_007915 [Vermiconidia calcicola]|uniref:Uncharacterized protein n=1 Tax=Vermiconidia calcicola TaxID=1690605 RepID=A0ACC3NCI0_9PEZI|nr:hypothetical protein LTR37_007915 [Vermiconidia calcicola]